MQAITPTLFPCYAAADRATVQAVAAFLERGADVRVYLDEGEMQPGEDLASKARDARMADMVLVFFSRDSLPRPWPRTKWEEALVTEPTEEGLRIGFVRCDDCAPPAVLRPRFELAGLRTQSLRELKRWVRLHEPSYAPPPAPRSAGREGDLEVLGIAAADRAGVETVDSLGLALDFVRAYREDFDEIFVLDCGTRSVTALAGDLGEQLGLTLAGDLDENLERLRPFVAARRFLVLLADACSADVQELVFGGRSSTLIVTEGGLEPSSEPIRRVQKAFESPAAIGWDALCEQARMGRRLTQERGRVAECYELMQLWHALAQEREDRNVLAESAREMAWILESWGRDEEARSLNAIRTSEFEDQMSLPF